MNKVSYMGNGEITEFDFRFPFYENNNVVVLKNNKPATGYTIVKTPAGDGADVPYLGGRVVFTKVAVVACGRLSAIGKDRTKVIKSGYELFDGIFERFSGWIRYL